MPGAEPSKENVVLVGSAAAGWHFPSPVSWRLRKVVVGSKRSCRGNLSHG